MSSPKIKDVKRLFALSGNQCAMPGCHNHIYNKSGIAIGQICHIRAANKGGPRYDSNQSEVNRHAFENLILICCNHHTLIDSDATTYPVEVLQKIKAIHELYAGPPNIEDANEITSILLKQWKNINIKNNSGNIAINSSGVIQGKTINIKTNSQATHIAPPAGSIGADVQCTGYIQHLITRYNKYASAKPDRAQRFSYGAISKNIGDKFGTNWKLIPLEKFDEVVLELHKRINRTKIARINKRKKQKSYSTFKDYIKKYG